MEKGRFIFLGTCRRKMNRPFSMRGLQSRPAPQRSPQISVSAIMFQVFTELPCPTMRT